MNSTHSAEVFRIKALEKHPNADKLSIVRFYGYTSIVRSSDFKVGDLAVYIPPDSVVPDTAEYEFLRGHRRIKASRLRGVMSQGLVMPAPPGSIEGDDVAKQLGITHYDQPIHVGNKAKSGGCAGKPPPVSGRKYDIESYYRYGDVLETGQEVEITEKIHGANIRFTHQGFRLYVGSRNQWINESDTDVYWKAVHDHPWLRVLCKRNPGIIFYGELYGRTQKMRGYESPLYGVEDKQNEVVIFDAFDTTTNTFLNRDARQLAIGSAFAFNWWERFKNTFGSHYRDEVQEITRGLFYAVPPAFYLGPFRKDLVNTYVTGRTLYGVDHPREGIVIRPTKEIWHPEVGRVIFKVVSPEYLEKAG